MWWLLTAETNRKSKHGQRLWRNPSAGREPSQFKRVKKGSSYLQNRQTNSFQKVSERSVRKRIEARNKYLTQRVAAPNLFSLTNQFNILCFWGITLSNNNYIRKNSHTITVHSFCRTHLTLFIWGCADLRAPV